MLFAKSRVFQFAIAGLVLASALIVAAGWSGHAQSQPRASAPAQARNPIVFVPGLMGSRLCRPDPAKAAEPALVWGDVSALANFSLLQLTKDDNGIRPCGVIRQITFLGLFTQDIYEPPLAHLRALGYREGENLFVFDYDWRRSVFDNAQKLAAFVDEKIPAGGRADIVAHSMGGLIARVYAIKHDGAARIARLFSAGSPFLGSAKVYETAANGWGVLNPAMGGLATFRRVMLSFPSIFEISPRYADCCRAGDGSFDMASAETWRELKWEGADPDAMADLKAAQASAQELQRIVETPLPEGTEDMLLIGIDQRTPMQVRFERGAGEAAVQVRTSWDGDATVLRDSAVLKGAAVHPTRFATHEKILHDPQVLEFLTVALSDGVSEAQRRVKVRPRATVTVAEGVPAELVGIVVTPREPVCRAGMRCGVHVHVRLGEAKALSADALRLTYRAPDGRQSEVPLRADRAVSDPANPLEQSFSGEFEGGTQQGVGMLTGTIALRGAAPRVIERPVAVVAR